MLLLNDFFVFNLGPTLGVRPPSSSSSYVYSQVTVLITAFLGSLAFKAWSLNWISFILLPLNFSYFLKRIWHNFVKREVGEQGWGGVEAEGEF